MKYLEKQIGKRENKLILCLHQTRGPYAEEHIHELRVNIKKIKGILSFLDMAIGSHFVKREKKIIRDLFRQAGNLREIQINKHLLRNAALPSAASSLYLLQLKKDEIRSRLNYRSAVKKFPEKAFRKEMIKVRKASSRLSSARLETKTTKFTGRSFRKIKKIHTLPSKPEALHRIRKLLKSLDPVLQVSAHIQPGKSLQKTLHALRKINTLLGNWHDREVFLDSLESFLKKNRTRNNLQPLLAEAENVRLEMDTIQKTLDPLLKRLC